MTIVKYLYFFLSVQYEYDGGEKAVLLRNTDTLKRASGSLARAHQVSADTDQIAVGVMEDLDDQKATLVRTRNRVSRLHVIEGVPPPLYFVMKYSVSCLREY